MFSNGRHRSDRQRGVALLIAIFALILISGVAISMIVMAGTESAINANYRRTTVAFYAAHAGIEEARERMVPCAPDTLWPVTACANPPISNDPLFTDNPLTVQGQLRYLVNPAQGENYTPQGGPVPYQDNEYATEFGGQAPPNQPGQTLPSSPMTRGGNQPPLPYKWVRITLKNEAMGGIDLDNNGILDTVLPVRVDGQGRQCVQGSPGCTSNLNSTVTSRPVYRVTSFSLEPSGSRRLLQAEVAQLPIINPNGAIASQAGVSINGNFNAFGGWPPIVQGTCGTGQARKTVQTCGQFSGGAVQPDCNNIYDPTTDTCSGVPRSHNDYCNVSSAVDSVSSGGSISAGANYSTVPDTSSGCTTQGTGCIFTVSPQQALSPNQTNWPYDMDQVVQMLAPPATTPIQQVDKTVTCGVYDQFGNRSCSGQGVNLGTLPSPWPPAPGTQPTNYQPKLTYADVGKGGKLKLTGASSGSGILVVEGDLEVQAGFQWYGLLLVRGVVTFLGGGATSTNIVGGVIAGTSVTNANTTTGGSVSVTYSSCAFRFNTQTLPLRYLSFREIGQ